jgi:hypothetical protein
MKPVILILFILFLILFVKFKDTFSTSSAQPDGSRCETNPKEIRIKSGDSCKLVSCVKGYKPNFIKDTCDYTPGTCDTGDFNDPHGFYAYDRDGNCTLNACDINYNKSSSLTSSSSSSLSSCNYLRSTVGTKCTNFDKNSSSTSPTRDINNMCIINSCKTGYYIYNNTCLLNWSTTNFASVATITPILSNPTNGSASITFSMQGDNPNKDKLQVSVPFNMSLIIKSTANSTLTVKLKSLECSITKNGIPFTNFTFYKPAVFPITKKIGVPKTTTNINIQQPYAQLYVDFTPDDSRTLDKYVITFTYTHEQISNPSVVTTSGKVFELNAGQSITPATGITYKDTSGSVLPFTIKKLITS